MKRIVTVLVALLAFGVIKYPIEKSISEAHRAAYFRGAKLDLTLREQIGQGAFLAALSGFRGVIADFLTIQANIAWEHTQWSRVALLYNQITTLQPRSTLNWFMAAAYLANDAATAALRDRQELQIKANGSVRADPGPLQQRLRERQEFNIAVRADTRTREQRLREQQEYVAMGRDFLERGIRNNPEHANLSAQLGALLRDKLQDHFAAYEAFSKAAQCADALGFEKRAAAFELSKCPGKEAEAYKLLKKYYDMGPQEWFPTLLSRLQAMEEKLNIPSEQRVYIPPKTHH